MTVWVISDTHFNHGNILLFEQGGKPVRPFASLAEMNECIMDNWVDTIKPGDKVYHLGDVLFGFNKADWMEKNFAKLPGKKRLVLGNHDDPKLLAPFFQKIMMWRQFNQFGLLLTHAPVHPSTLGEGRFDGKTMLNVHGHLHTTPAPDGPFRCVSVEQTGFKPVNLEELKR